MAAVVTATDKPAGRGHKMLQSAVKQYALAKGLPVLQPEKLRDPAFVDALRAIGADLFIVIAFRMMPDVVWQMPPLGTFNLHASLLPRYRGAAPINWAVINGDRETGVTTFFLKKEMDTGDVISQERVSIADDDNVGDVHDRLMALGARLTLKTVDDIIAGTVKPIPQELMARDVAPTPAPKIFRDTCHIDWTATADRVHNLVRGLSPYPAAWTELPMADGSMTVAKVFVSRIGDDAGALAPGHVVVDGRSLFVAAADRMVEIVELQPAGKRRMAAADYLLGANLATDSICPSPSNTSE